MGTFIKVFDTLCLAITLWLGIMIEAQDWQVADSTVSLSDYENSRDFSNRALANRDSQSNLESTSAQQDLSSNSFESKSVGYESRSKSFDESTSVRHETRSKSYESRSAGLQYSYIEYDSQPPADENKAKRFAKHTAFHC